MADCILVLIWSAPSLFSRGQKVVSGKISARPSGQKSDLAQRAAPHDSVCLAYITKSLLLGPPSPTQANGQKPFLRRLARQRVFGSQSMQAKNGMHVVFSIHSVSRRISCEIIAYFIYVQSGCIPGVYQAKNKKKYKSNKVVATYSRAYISIDDFAN